ncbi:BQ2448_7019 [Microbotryum intermedium]|uniref:BQ2448_7019 protein n=1 Tax=Microbotryum intermedium TaxID=269621 RepID=A0A238FMJ3_9BASI|nr:BQ2448_7019 [Microbotryum intermedium]
MASGVRARVPYTRARSWLATPLLVVLIPTLFAATLALPFLAIFSFVPILGFIALPSVLSIAVFSLYALPWILYLIFAQDDPPPSVQLPYLPYSPYKCLKITSASFQFLRDLIASGYIALWFDLQIKRFTMLSGREANTFVQRNIPYAEGFTTNKLDVYRPDGYDQRSSNIEAPVIVLVGGANWTMWNKTLGAQIALRLRRLGYCVVVPDWRQAPAKTPEMVTDLRLVLEWVQEHIKAFNGDADAFLQLHCLSKGYGSGAHLATLTVVQDAVVRSRDEHVAHYYSPASSGKPSTPGGTNQIEISAGIRRCAIWGEHARLPPIAGMILVAGVFDVIKQLRFEAKQGIEDVSALRRVCGPSTGASLLSCPSHLLYGAKEILDPTRLPTRFLIIAGGKDTAVHYTQSVLLRSLLDGVGVPEVHLKLYRDLTHVGSLCSLMHQTRYSPLFLSEIEALISSAY